MSIAVVLGCGCWVYGGGVYWLDLAAGFLSLMVAGSVAVLLCVLVMRRWTAAVVCVIGIVVGLMPLASGRAIAVGSEGVGDAVVMVGTLNIYPKNEAWREDLEVLMALGLDVVVIQEISPEMNRMVSKYGYLDEREMRHWVKRRWRDGEVSPGLIVSRWPLELIEPAADDLMGAHQLMCVVKHPDGEFVAGLVHPFSPRTVERWEAGNLAAEANALQAERAMEMTGLQMIVGADLNSSYGQVRGRALKGAGLSPSKPMVPIRWGSFPADAFGPMRVQLDDLWISEGIKTVSWSMTGIGGSDHEAVIGRFVLEQP